MIRDVGALHVERVAVPREGGLECGLVLRLPSRVDLVDPAVELLATECFVGFEVSPRARFRLRTVLAEALANAIECGNRNDPDKAVEVRADLLRDRVRVTVTDQGGGFDPATTPDPLRPETLMAPRGRGLFIIRSLAIEMGFNEKGNSIWMILPRS